MKENLKDALILESLHEYKKTIDSSSMYQEKDVQEAIYQVQDIGNGKAYIKNFTKFTPISLPIEMCVYQHMDELKLFATNAMSAYTFSKKVESRRVNVSLKSSFSQNESVQNMPGDTVTEKRIEYLIREMYSLFTNINCKMTDSQLKYMKSVFHNELKHRKEIAEDAEEIQKNIAAKKATEKILKDNIDEN